MSELRIITNHHIRPIEYWHELTPAEQSEFDWACEDDEFFRYKGEVYCVGEFMTCVNMPFPPYWDGYHSDSFFSGILVKYPIGPWEDGIIVGWYCS